MITCIFNSHRCVYIYQFSRLGYMNIIHPSLEEEFKWNYIYSHRSMSIHIKLSKIFSKS
jgi:hypothetical protein